MANSALVTLAAAAELAASRSTKAGAELRAHLELLERCPAERRETVVAALAVVHPHLLALVVGVGAQRDRRIGELLAGGAYPRAPLGVRARLVLGESPALISGGLTRAEAHRWLSEAPTRPAEEWLLRQHQLDDHPVHGVRVARWLIACDSDPQRRDALWREREERGPHGETIAGSYIQRIDELRPGDLRPSVEETFRRAGVRLLRSVTRAMARKSEPLAPVPRWWRPARCARLLLSAADLAVEGKIMRHCAATYVTYVRRGSSVLVALDVCGHRSTVELHPHRSTLAVRQHRGPGNMDPHPLCQRALKVLLNRWRKSS